MILVSSLAVFLNIVLESSQSLILHVLLSWVCDTVDSAATSARIAS